MWLLAIRFPTRGFTVNVGGHRFGFTDWEGNFGESFTTLDLGPLGEHYVPFSAATGLVLTIIAAIVLFGSIAWAGCRRRAQHHTGRR
jgi:hypothetical protein